MTLPSTTEANDLTGDDSGCDGDGVVRKVRTRERTDSSDSKKRKADGWCEIAGYWWKATDTFDIERLIDKKIEVHRVGKGKKKTEKEFIYYKVLWESFPPEVATWEPADHIHDDFIDEFEASLEAEEQLEAEAAAEEDEDDEE